MVMVDATVEEFKKLIAKRFIPKNSVIFDFSQCEEKPQDYTTIFLGNNKHIYHPIARYINHSCDPNTYVDHESESLIALRDIEEGEEITFDYLFSEESISSPFDCNCEAANCVGRVEK